MGSSASELFEIPKFFVFSKKGRFAGSAEERDFNYKIVPVVPKEGDKTLECTVWSGRSCADKAVDAVKTVYPLSQEGYDEMLAYLEGEYNSRPEVPAFADAQAQRVRQIRDSYLDLEDYFAKNTKEPAENSPEST